MSEPDENVLKNQIKEIYEAIRSLESGIYHGPTLHSLRMKYPADEHILNMLIISGYVEHYRSRLGDWNGKPRYSVWRYRTSALLPANFSIKDGKIVSDDPRVEAANELANVEAATETASASEDIRYARLKHEILMALRKSAPEFPDGVSCTRISLILQYKFTNKLIQKALRDLASIGDICVTQRAGENKLYFINPDAERPSTSEPFQRILDSAGEPEDHLLKNIGHLSEKVEKLTAELEAAQSEKTDLGKLNSTLSNFSQAIHDDNTLLREQIESLKMQVITASRTMLPVLAGVLAQCENETVEVPDSFFASFDNNCTVATYYKPSSGSTVYRFSRNA